MQISELIEAALGQTARGPRGNEGQGAGNEAGLSRPGSVLGANSKLAQSGATNTQGGFLETNGNAVVSPAGKQGGERRAGEGACETLYGRGGGERGGGGPPPVLPGTQRPLQGGKLLRIWSKLRISRPTPTPYSTAQHRCY